MSAYCVISYLQYLVQVFSVLFVYHGIQYGFDRYDTDCHPGNEECLLYDTIDVLKTPQERHRMYIGFGADGMEIVTSSKHEMFPGYGSFHTQNV